jgi:preprotein translocase subunit SecG
MLLLARVDWVHYAFAIPMALLSVFLILVVLVQRGRGGGLTGALGGMGGQSAFGTKAGDLFTRITIVVAALWVLVSMAALKVLNDRSAFAGLNPNQRGAAPLDPGKDKTTEDGKTTDDQATQSAGNAPAGEDAKSPPPSAPTKTPPADAGDADSGEKANP